MRDGTLKKESRNLSNGTLKKRYLAYLALNYYSSGVGGAAMLLFLNGFDFKASRFI